MTSDETCCCETPNLLAEFPEKTQELESFIDSNVPADLTMARRKGCLIQCLYKAQAIFGYLPLEVQELVAERLRLQQSDVYGVISFYSFFTDLPVGKYKINVCMGTACYVRGSKDVLIAFEEQLGIKEGETTEDGLFSLGGLRCVGACGLAPVVMVNEKTYGSVEKSQVKAILAEVSEELANEAN